MSAEAIWMTILGFALLYGGLVFCIGIAWYHGKNPRAGDGRNGVEEAATSE